MALHGGDGRWLLARVDIVVLLLLQVRIGVFFLPMQLIQACVAWRDPESILEGRCMTSDYDVISIIFDVHKYAKTPEDAVAEVVKAGGPQHLPSFI
ncbi:hypothetical protein HanXRQr2_Chr03g0091501 [Helianthus annuus]|uniref:Uncharacterized protein n=1 Tax=Helianthus annuus TaxID=4232 RepID=A0A251V4L4_HELAN|nr:hypothetical protein HanXRQr2_Chr03g0091501 [Helianthus annuus]KAJ0606681.1 hypothetical protein HanHA89_Chr03g0087911 [Helianthus annuus]